METGAERRITREQAEAALRAADAEERGTRHPPMPRWWYPAAAAAILGIFLLNAIGEADGAARIAVIAAVFALIAAVVVITVLAMRRTVAYRRIPISRGRLLAGAAIGATAAVVPVLTEDVVGSWVWVPAGVVIAALLVVAGATHERERHG